MKALVGLGNPGPEYASTRHNLGFRVAERYGERYAVRRFHAQGPMLAARVRLGGEHVLLVKPQTWMNRSGIAVRALVSSHDVGGDDLVVAHDDLDLDLGTVRVKRGGGHGGHNGLRSILEDGTAGEFIRVRLGIGRPEGGEEAAEWVLEPFPPEQQEVASEMVERGADAVEAVFRLGADRAMSRINRRPARPAEDNPGTTPRSARGTGGAER